jgi:cytochrome c oxidase subunit 2
MEHYLNLPPVGSQHGPEIDHSIGVIHWLMLILFIGWVVYYFITLVRFRKSKNPTANYHGAKSKFAIYLAGVVAVFELGMLFAVDAPIWARRVTNFPAAQDATEIRIVAEQFSWNIHYPGPDGKFGKTAITLVDADNPLGLDRTDPNAKDDITTINQLFLPVNKPVLIHLSSKDVIHSLNLPIFRVKQDAIPGQNIPVWFTPTKTSDQIREELQKMFSVSDLMKKVRTVTLPQISRVTLQHGGSMDDMMLMQDVMDSSGSAAVSKGDHLTAENVTKIIDAGMKEVSARSVATLDKYVSMSEMKDNTGTMIIGKNENLTEDAVTKLVEAGMKEISTRPGSSMDIFVVMESYQDKTGTPIATKGDAVSEEMLTKFADAGINEIVIAPATPTEIACAQLCGLGHYRMRGYISVQTPDDFKKWYDEQEAALNPPPTQQAPDSNSVSTDTIAVKSN